MSFFCVWFDLLEVRALDVLVEVFCAGDTGVTPTPTADGESKGFTGDTAMERGTGEVTRGVVPVGVVLPLPFFYNREKNVCNIWTKFCACMYFCY